MIHYQCPQCLLLQEVAQETTISCKKCGYTVTDVRYATATFQQREYCDYPDERPCYGYVYTFCFSDGHYLGACEEHMINAVLAAHVYLTAHPKTVLVEC